MTKRDGYGQKKRNGFEKTRWPKHDGLTKTKFKKEGACSNIAGVKERSFENEDGFGYTTAFIQEQKKNGNMAGQKKESKAQQAVPTYTYYVLTFKSCKMNI